MRVFLREQDYRLYLTILAEQAQRHSLDCLTYCLMPNHVHFLVIPRNESSLARVFGEAHRRYARAINKRHRWRGHLWQERFFSCPLSDRHLYNATRYVLTNPVRAGLVTSPFDWPYSSLSAQVSGFEDRLVRSTGPLSRIRNWDGFLSSPGVDFEGIRASTRTGRPFGEDDFLDWVEQTTSRPTRPGRPGPKRKRR